MIDRVAAALRRQAAGSAGRLQVVRAGPARRLGRVRRRGVAGASFLRFDGSVWTTDKDGIILACWPPRSLAVPARRPRAEHYAEPDRAVRRAGVRPIDAPAPASRRRSSQLSPPTTSPRRRSRASRSPPADRGARQRRGHRRPQGGHRERLVRRPALRHRGRLQDLRRVVQSPTQHTRGPAPPRAGQAPSPAGGLGTIGIPDPLGRPITKVCRQLSLLHGDRLGKTPIAMGRRRCTCEVTAARSTTGSGTAGDGPSDRRPRLGTRLRPSARSERVGEPDVLGLEELLDARGAALVAEPGLLDAAEGRAGLDTIPTLRPTMPDSSVLATQGAADVAGVA